MKANFACFVWVKSYRVQLKVWVKDELNNPTDSCKEYTFSLLFPQKSLSLFLCLSPDTNGQAKFWSR